MEVVKMTDYYLTPEHLEIAKRNGLSKKIVHNRFYQKGWTAERAITEPVHKRSDHNWDKWKRKAKVTKSTYMQRMRHGWDEEKAALTPSYREKRFRRNEPRVFTEEQERIMKENNISYNTAYVRVKKLGWSVEEAITVPIVDREESLRRARENSSMVQYNFYFGSKIRS